MFFLLVSSFLYQFFFSFFKDYSKKLFKVSDTFCLQTNWYSEYNSFFLPKICAKQLTNETIDSSRVDSLVSNLYFYLLFFNLHSIFFVTGKFRGYGIPRSSGINESRYNCSFLIWFKILKKQSI